MWRRLITPDSPPKESDALRFGILGAASIAPFALIIPAHSHPEVIVAAVAARDPSRAEAYAKKHRIPTVHKSYDDLIEDPSIDCVYIPLPNGLHYEWALKALTAGKHVLLEKPSVSNTAEAHSLFRHPLFKEPNPPVLLDAIHYRFHPAWQYFLTLFSPTEVSHVQVTNKMVAGIIPEKDIRFQWSLAGGALMDYGSYAVSVIRGIYRDEPSNVVSGSHEPLRDGQDERIERALSAKYEFPNGGTADIVTDLRAPWTWENITSLAPSLVVKLKEKDEGVTDGLRKIVATEIKMVNYMIPTIYHRIHITTTTSFVDAQDATKVVRSSSTKESKTMYNWAPTSEEKQPGEVYWTTYRHQLEQFVNRVRGRKGNGVWISGEDSIKQIETIDRTYEKLGLPIRPSNTGIQS
ncbi:NAD(P)-binding protein [Aaosphaeria arxii CBS 175.79]|uniref:D-xylose 1-dehydrogenase (NADP(+), D-xylono-1,5-lactone-forming) n=1 Tax=Aaosphaeria arxii CBS 175.79 TaxID=1450172 RepID=A0A6A5YAW1_9PLEO|nr:NAD(P)-binding protein [Aaosphaeria arxii CBS 175.79]KAF2022167.1 NAD(P)-binding protein [Aaosphaeria arxii CBS 175.79]